MQLQHLNSLKSRMPNLPPLTLQTIADLAIKLLQLSVLQLNQQLFELRFRSLSLPQLFCSARNLDFQPWMSSLLVSRQFSLMPIKLKHLVQLTLD